MPVHKEQSEDAGTLIVGTTNNILCKCMSGVRHFKKMTKHLNVLTFECNLQLQIVDLIFSAEKWQKPEPNVQNYLQRKN